MSTVKVYGADWCEDTQQTREHLDAIGVEYDYIDIDKNEQAREWIKRQNNGKQQTPTVDVAGRILIEPDNDELDQALKEKGV